MEEEEKRSRDDVDERRFSFWFDINRKRAVVNDLITREYVQLKRNDQYVYEFVKDKLSYVLEDGEELTLLYKSNDDVDYVRVALPGDDLINIEHLEVSKAKEVNSNKESEDDTKDISEFHKRKKTIKEKLNAFKNVSNENVSDIPRVNIEPVANDQTQSGARQPSIIWSHVRLIKENNVPKYFECNYCKNQYKYTSCTTNMLKHLTKMHPLFIQNKSTSVKVSTPASKRQIGSDDENVPSKKICLSNITNIPNIQLTFDRINSLRGGKAKEKLTDLILFMLCRDLQPLSVPHNEGFNTLMKFLSPHYTVPSRQTFVSRLEQKFVVMKQIVQRELADIPYYCVTADNWSDCSNADYIGITIHYLSRDLNAIKTRNLGTVPLHERHTAEYLKSTILELFKEFGISINKISAFLTDGEAALKKAAREIVGLDRHLTCVAHVLSKLIPEAVDKCPKVKEVIGKVKSIVTLIRRSIPATKRLQADQLKDIQDSSAVLNLLQDVHTRWTSTNDMLDRYVVLEKYLYSAMSECTHPIDILTRDEVQIVIDILKFTKPICNVITEMSGEKYVTSSLAIPFIHCLKSTLQSEKSVTETGHSFQKELLERMRDKTRCGLIEKYCVTAVSTILDPRFKKMHFEDPMSVVKALDYINKQLEQADSSMFQNKIKDSCTQSQSSTSSGGKHWEVHEKLLAKQKQKQKTTSLELQQYLELECIDRTEDVFAYWRNVETSYPNLSKIALKHLTALSTTVPSERQFSRAKLVKRHNRNKLTGRHLNELVFLSSFNYEEWS